MSDVRTIILHHKRVAELVNNEHLFSGRVELQNPEGKFLEDYPFINIQFRRMVVQVCEQLRKYPDAAVVFHRLEHGGLVPVQLPEELRVLLRDDPVRAIRQMDVQLDTPVQPEAVPAPYLRSTFDTLADAFGERVYLRMKNGAIEDPLTGNWRQLAYGQSCGWRIKGDNNFSQSWLPIKLEGAEMPDVPADIGAWQLSSLLNDFAGSLAKCRWASVLISDLLGQNANRFFLPRKWNAEQWITRQALSERLVKYLQDRKEAQSC